MVGVGRECVWVGRECVWVGHECAYLAVPAHGPNLRVQKRGAPLAGHQPRPLQGLSRVLEGHEMLELQLGRSLGAKRLRIAHPDVHLVAPLTTARRVESSKPLEEPFDGLVAEW